MIVGRPNTPALFDGLEGPFRVYVLEVRGGQVRIEGKKPHPTLPEELWADYAGWWPVSMVFPQRALAGTFRNVIRPYTWES